MEQQEPKKKNKNRSVHFYAGNEDYVKALADKNTRSFNNQINVLIETFKNLEAKNIDK